MSRAGAPPRKGRRAGPGALLSHHDDVGPAAGVRGSRCTGAPGPGPLIFNRRRRCGGSRAPGRRDARSPGFPPPPPVGERAQRERETHARHAPIGPSLVRTRHSCMLPHFFAWNPRIKPQPQLARNKFTGMVNLLTTSPVRPCTSILHALVDMSERNSAGKRGSVNPASLL